MINTRGNDLGHSNNEKDWTIRSQAPKYATQVYGEGSETTMKWVRESLATFYDGLRYSPYFI